MGNLQFFLKKKIRTKMEQLSSLSSLDDIFIALKKGVHR